MSGENKKTNKEDEFTFIQEKIVPKKKNKLKRAIVSLLSIVILAVIFGLVGRLTFHISEPLFHKIFGKNQPGSIRFPSDEMDPEPEDIVEPNPVPDPEEEPPVTDPEPVVIEQTIKADLGDYVKMYELLGETAEFVNDSIVSVIGVVSGMDWFQNPYESENITYGMVLARDDLNLYVLTDYGRIKDADSVQVSFHGTKMGASLHNADRETGLAVLAVKLEDIPDEVNRQMKEAVLGESYTLSPGDPVLALGSPNGYVYSVEVGIITYKSSYAYVTDNKIELFNTSIPDNSNGEGIITDLDGKVVGIITNHLKEGINEEVNTVIAISRIRPLLENLVNRSPQVYIGILGADISTDISSKLDITSGIYVSEVQPQSPAAAAGLKNGDVMLKLNDDNIASLSALAIMLESYQKDETVQITIKRMQKKESREIVLDVILEEKQ